MKYIFFDNDGTVCDSETLAMGVTTDCVITEAKKQNITIPKEDITSLFGESLSLIMQHITERYSVQFPEYFLNSVHKETVQVLSEKTKPTEGMTKLLEDLTEAGFHPVIVTSSELDRVVGGLKAANLKRFFPDNLIFSATSTLVLPQPKPSSAIYNYALKKLKIKAEDTITFEDSISGVASAKGTGIQCYGYLGASHIQHVLKAHGEKLLKSGVIENIYHWNEIRKKLGLPQRPCPTISLKEQNKLLK